MQEMNLVFELRVEGSCEREDSLLREMACTLPILFLIFFPSLYLIYLDKREPAKPVSEIQELACLPGSCGVNTLLLEQALIYS